jgi:GT2 family glycosyltransferase
VSIGGSSELEWAQFVSPSSFRVPQWLVLSAWLEHAPFAAWIVERAQPKTIVELGTETGFSYFAFCESVAAAGLPSRCFAVDTWQGDEQSGLYGPEVFDAVAAQNKRYERFSSLVRSSFDEAVTQFDDGSIDLLHVDGLHSYEAVRHDFEVWLPKLSDRAAVLFHDTNVHEDDFGVSRLWSELAELYPHLDFPHGKGLGVLGVGSRLPEALDQLLHADDPTRALIRDVYARLGGAVADREAVERLARDAVVREEELGKALAQNAVAQEELGKARAGLSRLRREIAGRTQEAGELGARLEFIESSTTWRVTAPPRSFIARHAGLRKSARWIYWAATFQLPARVRDRRSTRPESVGDYERWIELYDTLDDGTLRVLELSVGPWSRQPLISVVMPVHNTPAQLLRDAIESVLLQVYGNWELCIADDGSTSEDVREILDEYAAEEPRIKVVCLERSLGIAGASNKALELAVGDYVALLDHDDVLRPHALLMVASALEEHPTAEFLYSDEDKIDETGRRYDPYFKSDWNPELLLSQNYLCHLSVFRRDRARDIGGFRSAYDGAQDWDLFLRLTSGVDASDVVHIPQVLYHWRAVPGSAAADVAAKPGSLEAGNRAVRDHLIRSGVDAEVKTVNGVFQRVRYALPDPAPTVEVVVPTAFSHEFVEPLLEGVLDETDYPALRVTVVVNESVLADASKSAFLDRIAVDRRLRVLEYRDHAFNYAWVNNLAVAETSSDLVCLLNDDLHVIEPSWLATMVGHAVQDGVGAVGAMLYYPDDRIQHGGVILGMGGVAGHYHHLLRRGSAGYHGRAWCNQDLSCVTAGCMVVRRAAFVDAGGFDEAFAVSFNDVDLCLRMRDRGWRIVWTPDAELYHWESTSVGRPEASSERELQFADEIKLATDRWGETLRRDPFYSPNLSLDSMNRLAFPPRRLWVSANSRGIGLVDGAR